MAALPVAKLVADKRRLQCRDDRLLKPSRSGEPTDSEAEEART
jgi:hypothetical protein